LQGLICIGSLCYELAANEGFFGSFRMAELFELARLVLSSHFPEVVRKTLSSFQFCTVCSLSQIIRYGKKAETERFGGTWFQGYDLSRSRGHTCYTTEALGMQGSLPDHLCYFRSARFM
jgi:hypothetical protein